MIPTPWSLGSERSGEFAQANLVREKPGPPSHWVGDFRFPSQLDAGAGARTRRSRPTKRTHRDHPGLEHFSVVTLPFAFLAFPCALAGVLSPHRGLLFSRLAAHGLRPFDKLRAGFHGWEQLQKPDTKKANVRKCHLEACFGMRQEEAKTRRGEEKGRIAVKNPKIAGTGSPSGSGDLKVPKSSPRLPRAFQVGTFVDLSGRSFAAFSTHSSSAEIECFVSKKFRDSRRRVPSPVEAP
jgi:hypothetical protein